MAVLSKPLVSAHNQCALCIHQIQAVVETMLANNNFKCSNKKEMESLLLLLQDHARILEAAYLEVMPCDTPLLGKRK